ncbi:2-isopropylmalate synthase [candidate division NPL-UPA2 bacterium Unc8]|uniref:2-isopropylmalate synthase n=1 Tax=candidate division NPL-UPA2 bacterium Unc8 TaxID=1980939 RepID=A0A399FXB2_UNCN2|nr:2-isopropylmalate synthase [Bacillota bacterium]RII00116.1 MAG: 2-isopropylmalate synthase [candidate division NPL-UPA2 bacterium Unc8]
MKKNRIIIFDTTLRDGEQSPGIHLNVKEKLEIARQLARLGVDVIEAGFPISSPGDFEAVRKIAGTIKGPIIAGLSRALRGDIERCWEAVKEAEKPRIHVFIGTSSVHRESIMQKSEKEILKMAVDAVKIAKDLTFDVEFSPMDASRTGFDFLCEVIEKTIDSGATTINIPDTVGYALPDEFGNLIKRIIDNVANINKVILSVHCHDDLGLAMANSLTAILNGARQVECTVNGLGERAGNLSLEEIVMTLKARKDFLNFTTKIDTKEIYRTSRLVGHLTGMAIAHNKAIVGENAFAHSSGIHQDGILKKRETFEIMTPASVGFKESKIILTSRSGKHAVKHRLGELGYELDKNELDRIYVFFKELADKKKEVFDEDLETIVQGEISTIPEVFHLKYIHVTSGSQTVPTATVKLEKKEEVFEDAACGDGPVDAAYRTIDRITGVKGELLDYSLRAVTSGKDALGEVTVRIREGSNTVTGRGSSTDIIEASARAYLKAINKIVLLKEKMLDK